MKELTSYDLTFPPASIREEENRININFGKKDFLDFVITIQSYHGYFRRKQDLEIVAIQNLVKIKNLLQLDVQRAQELITEDEYENELKTNPQRYIIRVGELAHADDLYVINEIVTEAALESEITADEVAEMFSIDHNTINNHLGGVLRIG